MNKFRTSALVVFAALSLITAGCGDSQGTSPPGAVASAADGDEAALPLGRRAVSPFVDYGTSREAQPTKVGVRVLSVRKGRAADFEAFKLSRAQRRAVPYYVDAKFENLGRFPLSRNLLRASMEDAKGREHRPATLVVVGGSFRACPETERSALRPGQSFTACSAILLPKGAKPGRVRFQGDVRTDPVFWEARS